MRAFTGDEYLAKFEELHRLLDRAGKLLLEARKEHELAMEFVSKMLTENAPDAEDLRYALAAYKIGAYRRLPPFGDSQRNGMCNVNPAPDAAAPAATGTMGFIQIVR